MRPRRLLLISYLFPPAGGVGVLRALAYARYLSELGIEVWVLAARNPSTPVMDPQLVRQIPPSVHVEYTWTPEVPYAWRDRAWKWVAGGKKKPSAAPPGPAAEKGTTAEKPRAEKPRSAGG